MQIITRFDVLICVHHVIITSAALMASVHSQAVFFDHLQFTTIDQASHDKMNQASLLNYCMLQVIKNWTVGRPGNEATECEV